MNSSRRLDKSMRQRRLGVSEAFKELEWMIKAVIFDLTFKANIADQYRIENIMAWVCPRTCDRSVLRQSGTNARVRALVASCVLLAGLR